MSNVVESHSIFRMYWKTWRFLGQIRPANYRVLYYLYSFVLNALVTLWHPIHLIIGVFTGETISDVFKSVLIVLTVGLCTVKTIIMWWNLDKIRQIDRILVNLDKRVVATDEANYYNNSVVVPAKRFWFLVAFLCLLVAICSEAATIAKGILGEWRLSFSGYFPFDVYASTFNYVAAHILQIFGGCVMLAQNLGNDTYGAVALMALSGHMHVLRMRISKIGFDKSKTVNENNKELLACIQDHRNIIELKDIIENTITWCMYIQIIIASLSICITIIYIVFYVDDTITLLYYLTHLVSMPVEIFPCCYYGTYMELEFEQLNYAIFSCNWVDQNKPFKKNLLIFAEQSLRPRTMKAGYVLPISLDTFFATCKGAYSLYAVLRQIK